MERKDRRRKAHEPSVEEKILAAYVARKTAAQIARRKKWGYTNGIRYPRAYEFFGRMAREHGLTVQEVKRICGALTHSEIMALGTDTYLGRSYGRYYVLDCWGNPVWRVDSDWDYYAEEWDKRQPIDAPHSIVPVEGFRHNAQRSMPPLPPPSSELRKPYWLRGLKYDKNPSFPIVIN